MVRRIEDECDPHSGGAVGSRLADFDHPANGSPKKDRLVEARRLKVRASASQKDRARLRTGLAAEVRADALPGAVFEGRIRVLGQEADAGLAKQAQNPIANLISVPIQNNFNFGVGLDDDEDVRGALPVHPADDGPAAELDTLRAAHEGWFPGFMSSATEMA